MTAVEIRPEVPASGTLCALAWFAFAGVVGSCAVSLGVLAGWASPSCRVAAWACAWPASILLLHAAPVAVVTMRWEADTGCLAAFEPLLGALAARLRPLLVLLALHFPAMLLAAAAGASPEPPNAGFPAWVIPALGAMLTWGIHAGTLACGAGIGTWAAIRFQSRLAALAVASAVPLILAAGLRAVPSVLPTPGADAGRGFAAGVLLVGAGALPWVLAWLGFHLALRHLARPASPVSA